MNQSDFKIRQSALVEKTIPFDHMTLKTPLPLQGNSKDNHSENWPDLESAQLFLGYISYTEESI